MKKIKNNSIIILLLILKLTLSLKCSEILEDAKNAESKEQIKTVEELLASLKLRSHRAKSVVILDNRDDSGLRIEWSIQGPKWKSTSYIDEGSSKTLNNFEYVITVKLLEKVIVDKKEKYETTKAYQILKDGTLMDIDKEENLGNIFEKTLMVDNVGGNEFIII